MNIIDDLKDRWITRRTGRNRQQREYDAWYEYNVNSRVSTINEMFKNFEYVIEVDPDKFLVDDAISWVPHPDARQYFWPERALGNNCVWTCRRVFWDQWTQSWYINNFTGDDRVFVATNSGEDATMLTLKWT